MRKLLFLLALVALLGAAVAEGHLPGAGARNRKRELTATVDSVTWRADVTRVYCRIHGEPHTSNRIDSVLMVLPGSSAGFAATDIDPIYFERSFQWEDEGEIGLEIDFAPMKKASGFSLTFVTPYGEYSASCPAR